MKAISSLLAVACLLVASPTWAQLTFRGLGSSSTSADVRKLFPQARPQNYCRQGETVERSADGLTLCEKLGFNGYALDGVSFDVSFGFNPDGTLRFVSLIKLYGSYRPNGGSVSPGTINSTFYSLMDLFSSKYGPSVANPPGGLLRRGPVDHELEWQPGRGTKWQAGGDRILLRSSGLESKIEPGQYKGTVQIFYQFAKREEFDKF